MPVLSPYYYGKHKWDDYLLDLQTAIVSVRTAQQESCRVQSAALGVAQEQLAELKQQTDALRDMEDALLNGLEELRAEFHWGVSLLVDQTERQIGLLSQVAAKLAEIHATLQSPLLTQARELFQLGQEHCRKGLLDKALEVYLQAEQKNEVDFLLQLQIGKLYLYGRDEDDDVIDLPKAEKHLLLAARYAHAEKGSVPQSNEFCGQSYFHAAVAAYLIGEQHQQTGKSDCMRACLERALGYLSKAAVLWPRFTEVVYLEAKCHALLGRTQDAIQKLEILSDRDRRYLEKASQDFDLAILGGALKEPFQRAVNAPGPRARAAESRLAQARDTLLWAKRSAPASKDDVSAVASIENELNRSMQSLPTLNIDIEGLLERIEVLSAQLTSIAKRSFQEHIDTTNRRILSLEAQKHNLDSAIGQLRSQMKQTSGSGMGCFFSAVMFFLVVPLVRDSWWVRTVPAELKTYLESTEWFGPLIVVSILLAVLAAGVVGNNISVSYKNMPYQRTLDDHLRSLEECTTELPVLRKRFDALLASVRTFEDRQAAQASPM